MTKKIEQNINTNEYTKTHLKISIIKWMEIDFTLRSDNKQTPFQPFFFCWCSHWKRKTL